MFPLQKVYLHMTKVFSTSSIQKKFNFRFWSVTHDHELLNNSLLVSQEKKDQHIFLNCIRIIIGNDIITNMGNTDKEEVAGLIIAKLLRINVCIRTYLVEQRHRRRRIIILSFNPKDNRLQWQTALSYNLLRSQH